ALLFQGNAVAAVPDFLQPGVFVLMRRRSPVRRLVLLAAILVAGSSSIWAQDVVDRIVARVESDVILFSDVRLLSRYQKLVDGKSESAALILERLIDQWIVRNEAVAARFPKPSAAEVDRNVERLKSSFASEAEYQIHKRETGLTDADVREIVESQLYLSNYLDSRF